MKVTLWYTGLIAIILALVLTFVFTSSDKLLFSKLEGQVKENVHELVEELNDKHSYLDDDLEYYDDGVYISIYDEQGNYVEGNTPTDFIENTPFQTKVRTIKTNNQEWIVYDVSKDDGKGDSYWIRGIAPLNQISSTLSMIILIACVSFPFFILLAGFGGYFITKRAFKPVQQITDAANQITDAKDLSKRIHLQGAKDEIYALAQTFDCMFERLEKSFESEKQFTSDASHELRTPTSVIISQCEYALSQSQDAEEMKASLEVILRQSKKMSGLISQLLLLARADNKKLHLVLESIDVSELMEMVVDELTELAEEADIQMKREIEENIFIKADQTLIMRMVINLITNAITYGKQGGWVKIRLYEEGTNVVGQIIDNGIGIAEQDQSKIWNRFYRVNTARTASAKDNTGLGLSMVKWIAEKHGGTVAVESKLGEGSVFTFTLPIK